MTFAKPVKATEDLAMSRPPPTNLVGGNPTFLGVGPTSVIGPVKAAIRPEWTLTAARQTGA